MPGWDSLKHRAPVRSENRAGKDFEENRKIASGTIGSLAGKSFR
jgi:hypothetical protein